MVSTRLLFAAPLAGALHLAVLAPVLADSFVTGDSLGQGIAAASGLPNRARLSVRVSDDTPIEQISALPRGSVAFMSLGTNDAVGPVNRLGPNIDRLVRAARERGVRLVWIGPPCMLSRRVPNVAELDAILRERVRGEGIIYVSALQGSHCTAAMRARDGVHFTPAGYRALWELARAASGAPGAASVAVAQGTPAVARAGTAPAERPQVVRAAAVPQERATAARATAAPRERAPVVRAAVQTLQPPEASPAQPERARPATRQRQLTPMILTVPAPRPAPPPQPAQNTPSFWPFFRS